MSKKKYYAVYRRVGADGKELVRDGLSYQTAKKVFDQESRKHISVCMTCNGRDSFEWSKPNPYTYFTVWNA